MFREDGPSFAELMTQAMSSTKAGYDKIAPKFDNTPFRTPVPVLEQVAGAIGPARSVGRALDVCCGTGAGMIMLRPLCREAVVGLDFSPGMLAEAQRRVAAADGDAEVELVQGDALNMPFEGVFDVVTCFGAFGHIVRPDQPRFLRGIHRALKPGGRFVFVTSEMPSLQSRAFWLYHGFNAVMRVRNRLVRPPFVMYYLNFLVPDILPMFEEIGFTVDLKDVAWSRRNYKIAVATRA